MKSINLKCMKAVGPVVKRRAAMVGVAMTTAAVSSLSFAQASGTSTTPAFSDTAILSSINGVAPIIIDVGGAVLAVVTVAWGFKTVKGFLGR